MTENLISWYALDVNVVPHASDAVEGILNEFDALGIEIDQLRKKPGENVVVTGYFNGPLDENSVRSRILGVFDAIDQPASSLKGLSWRQVEDQDWLLEWKKHWRATEVGKFVIAPPWDEVNDDGNIVIRIEPNMAFGTGTHETTKLCLSAISEIYRPPATVLDVGTGTGILAIAAAKLGADRVAACDTDVDSIAIARENAILNRTPEIEFSVGTLDQNGPKFDLVLANLTLDVIEPLLELLLERSKGILVMSGILMTQEDSIVNALTDRGYEGTVETMGEWISVTVRK